VSSIVLWSRNRRLLIRAVVGTLVSGGLFAALFLVIDVDSITSLFRRATTGWLLAGLGLWTLLYLARAARFCMLAPRTPYATMLAIAAVHNLLLRVMPFRSGEISYAILVRRAGSAALTESLLGLALLRILDGVAVVSIFAVSLALDRGAWLGSRTVSLWAAFAATLIGFVALWRFADLFRLTRRALHRLATFAGWEHRPFAIRVFERADHAIGELEQIGARALGRLFLLTLVQWGLIFGTFAVTLRAFSLPIALTTTVLGATAAVVSGFLPIGGIGSFGTLEAGWALGFVMVGLPRDVAVASGFGVSLSTLAYTAILGLPGWLWLTFRGRPVDAAPLVEQTPPSAR
jgi:uncharacterized membrane protein YbhN (UPF0104 family)